MFESLVPPSADPFFPRVFTRVPLVLLRRSVAALGRCRVCLARRAQHCQVATGRARVVVRLLVVVAASVGRRAR